MDNRSGEQLHTSGGRKLRGNRFLILLMVFGVVALTVTKGWYVYTDPLKARAGMILDGWELASGEHSEKEQLAPGSKGKTSGAEDTDPEETGAEDAGSKKTGAEDAGSKKTGAEDAGSEKTGAEDADPERTDPDMTGEDTPGEDTGNAQTDPEQEGGQDDPEPDEAWELTYESVEDDYFADAVFIGDSRTVGMYEYGGLQDVSTFYAATGLSVHKLFSAKIAKVAGSDKKVTVEEALSQNQFSKIYFMIGINEMGTGTMESFLDKYAESVAHIRELQPDAIIYLQSIMKVSAKRSAKGDYITNEGIDMRNEGIAAMADNEHIFYLDVNQAVCDDTGALNADYTGDGVHLKAQYISLWKDYLKTHAVVLPR